MNDRIVPLSDVVAVVDPTPVEHFGGPNDGELRRADENGCRPNGLYVVVNHHDPVLGYRVIAKRYVPA